jgi:hypothetical protein
MKVIETIDKYKVRLVIKRFKQQKGMDYFDTYSSKSRITFIQILIVIEIINMLEIHQMDIKQLS